MSLKIKFPIRTKLLLLMSALVVFSIFTYLSLAIKLFQDDKTTLIYELNAGAVRTLSTELRSRLESVVAKVKLLTQGHQNPEWVKIILGSDEDLLGYSLYRRTSGAEWQREVSIDHSAAYAKLHSLAPGDFEIIRAQAIPFEQILERKTWISSSMGPSGPPVLRLAQAVLLEGETVPRVALADIRLDPLLEQISKRGIATVYVVDSHGDLVAHPDAGILRSRSSLRASPIVRAAVESELALQLKEFEYEDEGWLGAFSDVGLAGLKVVSQVPQKQVFRAAMRLVNKSLLFGLLIVTIALLLSTRVARSMTDPLNALVAATERVTRWEFGEKIEVKTSDEVGELARAFNIMATDLQGQREQIDRHQAELEQKVRERTAELETQKKRAAEANEALVRTTRLASLGELAGAAAHEVLNPVNNINIRLERMKSQVVQREREDTQLLEKVVDGWKAAYQEGGWDALRRSLEVKVEGGTQTLIDEDFSNLVGIVVDGKKQLLERQKDFQFLEQEIVRITKIVNNMRSLARVRGDRKRMDVQEAIDDTVNALSDIAEKNKVRIEVVRGPNLDGCLVLADKDELVQVFSNLIRNAFYAIRQSVHPGNGKLTITTARNGARVEIRIWDNGTGIPPEHLARIFEPDFTTKSIDEGTGLGLSISRRIARAFGGDLEVETTAPGEGTRFLAWLPIHQQGVAT